VERSQRLGSRERVREKEKKKHTSNKERNRRETHGKESVK
jgi:hypothetical protein